MHEYLIIILLLNVVIINNSCVLSMSCRLTCPNSQFIHNIPQNRCWLNVFHVTCGLRPPTSGWRSPGWPPFRVADIQEIGHTSSLPSIGLFNLMITRSTARVNHRQAHLLWLVATLTVAWLYIEPSAAASRRSYSHMRPDRPVTQSIAITLIQ